MSGDDQDLGAVDLELTVDSADDGRRFEVEDEVEPAIGAWPEPEHPDRVSAERQQLSGS